MIIITEQKKEITRLNDLIAKEFREIKALLNELAADFKDKKS